MSERLTAAGRRVLAWLVIAVCALLLLRIIAGVVIGLVHGVITLALVAVLVIGVAWALRRT